jgi:hypothetical protein
MEHNASSFDSGWIKIGGSVGRTYISKFKILCETSSLKRKKIELDEPNFILDGKYLNGEKTKIFLVLRKNGNWLPMGVTQVMAYQMNFEMGYGEIPTRIQNILISEKTEHF